MASDAQTAAAQYKASLALLDQAKLKVNTATNYYLKLVKENADGSNTGRFLFLSQDSAKKVGQYTDSSLPYLTAQFAVPLADGSYMTSTSLGTGPHNDDTLYTHWSSSFGVIGYMKITDGGHGSMFGVEESSGTTYLWITTKNYDSANARWRITRVAFNSGATYGPTDSALSNLYTFPTYDSIRTTYDSKHGYPAITRSDNTIQVLDKASLLKGTLNVLHTASFASAGFDANTQTFQSASMSYPYVFFQTGAYSGKDTPTVFAFDISNGSPQFTLAWDTSKFGMAYALAEPETCYVYPDGDGLTLLVSFNNHVSGVSGHIQYFYKVPITNASKELVNAKTQLDVEKKNLASVQTSFNSAQAFYQKYSTANSTVKKDTAAVTKAQKKVTSTQTKINTLTKQKAAITKQLKKTTGSKKTSLTKQLANINKSLKSCNAKLKTDKTKLTTAKQTLNKYNKDFKKEDAKLLKSLISSAIAEDLGGTKNAYITPHNPGSAESYVILQPDSIEVDGQSTITSHSVIKGQPYSEYSSSSNRVTTLTGSMTGDMEKLKKKWLRMETWRENGVILRYVGKGSMANVFISDLQRTIDKDYINTMPYTLTLEQVRLANSNTAAAKKSTSKSGKLSKTKGSGKSKSKKSTIKVKSGDTFAKLAKHYKVSVTTLKKWNGTKLVVGKRIRVT